GEGERPGAAPEGDKPEPRGGGSGKRPGRRVRAEMPAGERVTRAPATGAPVSSTTTPERDPALPGCGAAVKRTASSAASIADELSPAGRRARREAAPDGTASATLPGFQKKSMASQPKTDTVDVLIVDDDLQVRSGLREALEGEGIVCHVEEDGLRAFDWLRDGGNDCRLILLDMATPRINGWQFLELRAKSPKI